MNKKCTKGALGQRALVDTALKRLIRYFEGYVGVRFGQQAS